MRTADAGATDGKRRVASMLEPVPGSPWPWARGASPKVAVYPRQAGFQQAPGCTGRIRREPAGYGSTAGPRRSIPASPDAASNKKSRTTTRRNHQVLPRHVPQMLNRSARITRKDGTPSLPGIL